MLKKEEKEKIINSFEFEFLNNVEKKELLTEKIEYNSRHNKHERQHKQPEATALNAMLAFLFFLFQVIVVVVVVVLTLLLLLLYLFVVVVVAVVARGQSGRGSVLVWQLYFNLKLFLLVVHTCVDVSVREVAAIWLVS